MCQALRHRQGRDVARALLCRGGRRLADPPETTMPSRNEPQDQQDVHQRGMQRDRDPR